MKKGLFISLLLLVSIIVDANPFVFGNKRVSVISPTLFRLEYAQDGKFLDSPTLFAYKRDVLLADSAITISHNEQGQVVIATTKVCFVFDEDNLPFGQINAWFYFTMDGKEKKITARPLHSKTANLNLGGSVPTLDRVHDEIPLNDGLHSRDGWYYIIDSNTEYLVDDWFKMRDEKHIQDMYCFVYGNDFRAPLRDLGLISGQVPMTRKYVHGIWYSRWYPYTRGYIDTLVAGYEENGFPLDILSMDMDWHRQDATVGAGHNFTKGWTGYSWNKDIFPDPAQLIEDLKKDSIYVCLNEHPHDGVKPHEDMYAEFMHQLGKQADGTTLLFDAGDKNYMDAFLPITHHYSDSIGVAFWWMDWQQDYLYPIVRGSRNMNHLAWLNKLWYDYEAKGEERGICYSRWGGWGSHRYPLSFSGDADGNWNVLAFEVKLSQTAGSAGCYYWAHDVGGFHGGTNPELLTRWAQFATLSAALRTHAARGKDLDRRPWIWGQQATDAMRITYRLRACMLPYIYSSVWQTHCTMVPLNRPMYIDYNQYPEAFDRYNQYMFGDLLLCAPITSAGIGENLEASQHVWFPKGDTWYDYFTGKRYEGGSIHTITKDIYSFPLFVKAGWCLPMQPYSNHPASAALDTLVIRVYPTEQDVNNTYTLYEDDGITKAYESGAYATTDLGYHRFSKNGKTYSEIIIYPTIGSYQGQPTKRAYRIEVANKRVITIRSKNIRKPTIIKL